MPRIRSLKYEYFVNEDLAKISIEARLLGLGITTLADREGRLEDRPLRIKVLLFPYHDVDLNAMLSELQTAGFIQRYLVDGKAYIRIVNFTKHQHPHPKEPESCLPSPLPAVKGRVKKLPAVKFQEEPGGYRGGYGDLGSGNGSGSGGCDKVVASPTVEIFNFWKAEMNKPTAQLTADRKVKIQERLKDSTPEEIKAAVLGCKRSDFHMGREPGKSTKHDDIELICRKRSKLEMFIALAPSTNGKRVVAAETDEQRETRESCLRCFGTSTENIPGKGGRLCNHKPSEQAAQATTFP